MNPEQYQVAAAATNGRPQRLVCVEHVDGTAFRDHINTNSANSRRQFIRRAAGKFNADEQELQWLDDAITNAADEADAEADATAAEGDSARSTNQATQIVELAACAQLFHDQDREAFARFPVDEHMEVAGVRSKHFRRWLSRRFFLDAGKAASSQALQDALGVLEGQAIFAGPQRSVHVRVADHEGRIYLDLCNATWQVVEVDSAGWRILDDSPVMFRRAQAMLPLPAPVGGGSVDELRQFVHLDDGEWTLLVAWLVAALRPTGPYPVLNLQGEHGSGKSTACRMARALVDPNTAMLRTQPREPRDLMIASKNGWVIALDNLSSIQAWQSDCLCRLSTGGGFSTRKLYENDEEAIFDAQRPMVINGIDDVATRADLLDRCLLVTVPRIEADKRRPEADLWAAFERARPRILGAFLSAVATALRNVDATTLPRMPRMADFAVWATAAEPGIGLAPGQFLAAYEANREAGNEVALEASPVGKAVLELAQERCEWSGTATELLRELETRVDDGFLRLKSWPSTPRTLSSQVKRLAPNLREAGSDVDCQRTGRKGSRIITLRWRGEQARISSSASSASSADHESSGFIGPDADVAADDVASADACQIPSSLGLTPEGNGPADATDDADAGIPSHSRDQEWVEV